MIKATRLCVKTIFTLTLMMSIEPKLEFKDKIELKLEIITTQRRKDANLMLCHSVNVTFSSHY